MGLQATTGGMFTAPDTAESPNLATWLLDALQQVEDRIGSLGILSGQIAAAAGWSLSTAQLRIANNRATIYINASRTDATIAGTASGNITNVSVAQVTPSQYWPKTPVPASVAATGIMIGAYVWTDGGIGIGALPPNVSISTGDSISLGASWDL